MESEEADQSCMGSGRYTRWFSGRLVEDTCEGWGLQSLKYINDSDMKYRGLDLFIHQSSLIYALLSSVYVYLEHIFLLLK